MKASSLIHTAKAAIDVLELASRHADNRWEWWQINRLASEIISGLRQIEQNEEAVPSLRKEAREDADSLRAIQAVSCAKVEEFDRQPPIVSGGLL